MMNVKVHSTPDGRTMLCITDSDILGKKFEDEAKQLDFTTDFFKGNERTKEQAEALLKGADQVILSGKESVQLGKDLALITEDILIEVQGIPQGQILRA